MKKNQHPDREIRWGEVSSSADRSIEGVAIVYGSWSNPLRMIRNNAVITFREMIMPHAFDELINTSDVVALYNHNEETGVLARNTNGTGTLTLENDEQSLKYRFEAPDTTLGNDTLESIRRGDISKSSFAFTVAKGGERWEKGADGTFLRYVDKASALFDVSMVVRPAYSDSQVSSRGLDEFIEIDEAQAKADEEKRNNELNEYFVELKKLIV